MGINQKTTYRAKASSLVATGFLLMAVASAMAQSEPSVSQTPVQNNFPITKVVEQTDTRKNDEIDLLKAQLAAQQAELTALKNAVEEQRSLILRLFQSNVDVATPAANSASVTASVAMAADARAAGPAKISPQPAADQPLLGSVSLEALYNKRSFSVLAEYTQAWVNSPAMRNPSFNGSYVTVSYFLTNDTRAYDKRSGNIVPMAPRSRMGAVELVGRVGYVDLDDTLIKGGKLTTWYAGANWWASRQWKVGMGYGLADLDRFNTTGRTQRFLARLMWVY